MVNQPKPTAAIFGGSFDPPHKGHQEIVKRAVDVLEIDTLLVIPAYLNPFKSSSCASASKRLEWCHRLFGSLASVEVEAYEIEQGRSVTSSETVKHFSKQYNIAYLIIGADNLPTLSKWHDFEFLNRHVTWVVVTREGYDLKLDGLQNYRLLEIDIPFSSTQIRESMDVSCVDTKIEKSVKKTLKDKRMTMDERIEKIVAILDEKKAEEIEVFNLEHADYIAKRVVIANSLNSKHTLALYDHLKKDLKAHGEHILASDISDEWVVADLGDILIHLMIPEYRQRYSLEQFLSELIEKQKEADASFA